MAGHAWTSVQPGLLEAPIPTCWLLGGALPPGRGVVLRLQEMVGEGQQSMGMRAGVPGARASPQGRRRPRLPPRRAGGPTTCPHGSRSREQSPERAETTSRPRGRGGGEAVTRLPELRVCWVVDRHQVEEAAGSGHQSSVPGPQARKQRGLLSEPLPVDRLPLGLRARPSSKSWSFLDGRPSAYRVELPGHLALG